MLQVVGVDVGNSVVHSLSWGHRWGKDVVGWYLLIVTDGLVHLAYSSFLTLRDPATSLGHAHVLGHHV